MVTITSTIPGAPRTETAEYHFQPGRPDPSADRCTDDDVLTIAADACRDSWPLAGSRDHIELVCRLTVRLDSDLRHALEGEGAARKEFTALRALHDEMAVTQAELVLRCALLESKLRTAETMRVSALQDADQQRRIAVRLSEENAALRLAAGIRATCGACYLDTAARLECEARQDDLSDADTVVVEVPL